MNLYDLLNKLAVQTESHCFFLSSRA